MPNNNAKECLRRAAEILGLDSGAPEEVSSEMLPLAVQKLGESIGRPFLEAYYGRGKSGLHVLIGARAAGQPHVTMREMRLFAKFPSLLGLRMFPSGALEFVVRDNRK